MSLPRIGILGASGKMGQVFVKLLDGEYSKKAKLAATCSTGESKKALFDCDVVIDFSSTEAAMEFADEALKIKKIPALVLGTTGWTPDQWKTIEKLAART